MKIYIDGENCRKGLARVLTETRSIAGSRDMENYRLRDLLTDVLEKEGLDIRYYASEIRLPNGYQPQKEIIQHVQKIKEYNRKWVPALKRQNIEYVKAGYLKVKSAKKCRKCNEIQDVLQEKGVDVRIAVDMLEDSYAKEKVIVIMSSDTDLCPALHRIKAHGSKVIYIAFADFINRAVSATADETVAISTAKIQKYFK